MSADAGYMSRALALAERGRGTTSPNPMVGAVVVDDEGVVVGRGSHAFAGGPHAEVIALAEAGERARGATLYCTLEPCSHTGRTGPCAPLVVAAGIRRAVLAMEDPEPAGQWTRHRHSSRPRRGRDGRPARSRGPSAERTVRDPRSPRPAARHDEGGAQRRRPGGARRRASDPADRRGGRPARPSRSGRSRCDR